MLVLVELVVLLELFGVELFVVFDVVLLVVEVVVLATLSKLLLFCVLFCSKILQRFSIARFRQSIYRMRVPIMLLVKM